MARPYSRSGEVRSLRAAATKAVKTARSQCHYVTRDARAVARAACEDLKIRELRVAKGACERLAEAASAARTAYEKARPVPSKKAEESKARVSERRGRHRENAIASVMEWRDVPREVAEAAVRKAERTAGLPPLTSSNRWEVLAERAGEKLPDAWLQIDREMSRRARREAPPPEPPPVLEYDPRDFSDDLTGFDFVELQQ